MEADELETTLDELENGGLSDSPLTHFTSLALVLLVLVILVVLGADFSTRPSTFPVRRPPCDSTLKNLSHGT